MTILHTPHDTLIDERKVDVSWATFVEMVNAHDLSYGYSDEASIWSSGQAEWEAIQIAAHTFPRREVEHVWNEMVRREILQSHRADYYWKKHWPCVEG